jgi:cell division protein FtsQ
VATAARPDGTGTPAAAPGSKRAHPWKAAFFVLAVVAIIAGVTWALLGSKFLVVRSITVNGAPDIPRSQVITAAGVRAGTPLIRISTGTVARRVERLTLVESARVTRSWPNAITITIVERTAALAVREPAGWDLVDRTCSAETRPCSPPPPWDANCRPGWPRRCAASPRLPPTRSPCTFATAAPWCGVTPRRPR